MVEIVPYRPEWPAEFEALALRLRSALGPEPRIEHVGSTAVPGLAAKDVLDVQIEASDPRRPRGCCATRASSTTAATPTTFLRAPLPKGGTRSSCSARRASGPSMSTCASTGAPNARYALLCRDYLRAHAGVAGSYAELKRRLAALPIDRDQYSETKDPVFDLIMAGAEDWAAATGWAL